MESKKEPKKMADFGSGERSRDPRQERSIASGGNIFMRHRCATRKIYVQKVSVEN